MRFLSVCSGIEAASVAFAPLGWKAAAFSEIEPFPSAVLAHHYPDTPNLGNMTKHQEWSLAPIGLVCGGTPCQAFSVAGQRRSMDDERGNLSLTFCRIADQFDPEWVLWENVPGVLSTHDNAFGCFLAELVGADEPFDAPGGKWPKWGVVTGPKRTAAWRVLDAQFFGVAQRRRRVFVLASRGSRDWRSAAALFPVGESVHWNSAPSREAREESATSTLGSTQGGSDVDHARAGHLTQAFNGNQTSGPRSVTSALSTHGGACGRMDFETETFVAATITQQISEQTDQDAHNGNLIPVAFNTTQVTSATNRSNPKPGDPYHPLTAEAHAPAIAQGVTIHGTDGTATVTSYSNLAQCLHTRTPGNIDNSSTTVVQHPIAFPANLSATQHTTNRGTQTICITGDVTHTLKAKGFNASEDGTGRGQPIVPVAMALRGREGGATIELGDKVGHCLHTSSGGGDKPHVLAPVAFQPRHYSEHKRMGGEPSKVRHTLSAASNQGDSSPHIATTMQVRRLTPVECERLQGFPDNYTMIPWRKKLAEECPDGPRYKALGNSWAVPCVAWIGRRIEWVRQQEARAAA